MALGEMEDVALCHLVYDGNSTYVHAMVLDNDWAPGDEDDVYVYHIAVPDASVL